MYISDNWSELMQPGLRKVFDGSFREFTSNLPALYSMQSSKKQQEFDLTTDDKSSWEPKQGDIKFEDEVQGYKTTYTHTAYVSGKKFERELLMDDQYGVVERRVRLMARGARLRRERDGAAIFNNAFNASITYGDGVSLCNASHPSRNDTALTRSNTGVLSLTDANVEATRRLFIKQKTGTGEPVFAQPDMLIVPLELERQSWELLNSKGRIDTANNNANFHVGKYKLMVWPNFLTSATRWWMVDSTLMKEFLLWFDREDVQFFKDRDLGTLIAAFAGYMRYSQGSSDFVWCFGQNPA